MNEPRFYDNDGLMNGRHPDDAGWITIMLSNVFRNEACGICELYGAHIAQVYFQIRKRQYFKYFHEKEWLCWL